MENKIKNITKIGLPAFILGFGLNYFLHNLNNSPNEELEKTLEMTNHLEKLTNYKPLEKNEIDSAFSFLNYGLREYLDKVYIIKSEDLGKIGGHQHGNIICLPEGYSEDAIFHESAHVRKNTLDNLGLDFSNKWREIANFYKYGENNSFIYKNENKRGFKWKEDSTEIPKSGLLTPYSAKSIDEDVAEFVKMSMKCLSKNFLNKEDIEYIFSDTEPVRGILEEYFVSAGIKTNRQILEEYAGGFPLYFADTTDHRYKQKLDLLKEYEFFTKEEHEKLTNDLGSLNYLLKE